MDLLQEFAISPDSYLESLGIRAKRSTEDHDGFKVFPIPFSGVEVGVKYADPTSMLAGGEVFVHATDLQNLLHKAWPNSRSLSHGKSLKVHAKFDGGATVDSMFIAKVDFHLEHLDGKMEEGALKVVRERVGNEWHTSIKTETGTPMELDFQSDWATQMTAKYVNAILGHDMTLKVVRSKFNIFGTNDKEIEFHVEVTNNGEKYDGQIAAKLTSGQPTKVLVDFKKGEMQMVQMKMMVKALTGKNVDVLGKYVLMGVEKGAITAKYIDDKFTLKAGTYKLVVDHATVNTIKVMIEKDSVEMWSFTSHRENKSVGGVIDFEICADIAMSPESHLQKRIAKSPIGAFKTRTNKLRVFIDTTKNVLLNKFMVKLDMTKDAENAVAFVADTTATPYKFTLAAPALFTSFEIPEETLSVTVNHKPGQGLTVDTNVLGVHHFDVSRTPNTLGGSTIKFLMETNGRKYEYHGDTTMTINADMIKLGLKSTAGMPMLADHVSDFEVFVDKKNKNALMNKFYVKGVVSKAGTKVFDMLLSTNEAPYKVHLFFPAALDILRPGMTEVDVDMEHIPGQMLEMKVNHRPTTFKGFKIIKTGEEVMVEWDGKQLGNSMFSLTDRKFQVTDLTHTFTLDWAKAPSSPDFMLDNKVHMMLTGKADRKLELDLGFGMSKVVDMFTGLPETGFFKLTAGGKCESLGDFTIKRDAQLKALGNTVGVEMTGEAKFGRSILAHHSPMTTKVDATYNIGSHDMVGMFQKVLAGHEYSISFPVGTFGLPTIQMASGWGFPIHIN